MHKLHNYNNLIKACEDFVKGWSHFCDRINWKETNLDAEAIRFMNENPGRIKDCLDDIKRT